MTPTSTGRCALLAGALALSGCALFGGDDLPEPAGLEPVEQQLDVRVAWDRGVGGGSSIRGADLTLALTGGRLYAASAGGDVTALKPKSGKKVWRTDTDQTLSAGPGVARGVVAVSGPQGEVVALEAETGAVRWRAEVAGEILASPRVAPGVVVVRAVNGRVYGLALADGSEVWRYEGSVPPLTLRGTSAPVVARGAVIVGFDDGQLVALDPSDGTSIWETEVAATSGRSAVERMADIDADPRVLGDAVYAVAYQGRAAQVSLSTGTVLWGQEMSSYAGLDVDARHVYVTDADSRVVALDRNTGGSRWRQDALERRELTAPKVFEGGVVVGDLDGYLHWLARDSGTIVARKNADRSAIVALPVSDGERLYALSADGEVIALTVGDD